MSAFSPRAFGLGGLVLVGVSLVASRSKAENEPADPLALPATPTVREGRFATASVCARCHDFSERATATLHDEKGRNVAPYDLFSSTMMANAARDPFFRATVAAEVEATPSKKAEIEAKCLRCHSPMATHDAGTRGERLSLAHLARDDAAGALARDGASCTLCHQIAAKGLGEPSTFSGHFVLGEERTIHGPHARPFAMPMRRMSGFTPVESAHVLRSALCSTCHTLFTDALAPDGAATGHVLPEQTPYLEWKNSVWNDEVAKPAPEAASCQRCHLPTTDEDGTAIRTRIAHNPGGRDWPPVGEREPLGRHLLVGGNVLVPAILRDNAELLRPIASRAAFDATIARAREQLEKRTAKVSIGDVTRDEGRLVFTVRLENQTGHKLPTGHPSRRAWLRVRVFDREGHVAFASGEHDAEGRIVGADGKPLPFETLGGPVSPHRTRIERGDEVPVYEAVMADPAGAPTFRLLRGAKYLKDDRLLPRGWSPEHEDAKLTAPVGVDADADFRGGEDEVEYRIPAPTGAGPYRIEASLVYQTLGSRWAAELFAARAPEVASFERLWKKADRTPVTLGTATRKSE